jgi:NitT/TauT family transport system ATP-binding protein
MTAPHEGIEVRAVDVRYRRGDGRETMALRGVDLVVPRGQFVCIVGKSGGGKSTLVRTIAGLARPSTGSVNVLGRPVEGPSAERAMVFQEDTVFPWMRVQANVEFALRAKGIPAAVRAARAKHWLEAVGLADAAGAWPRELSGGMRKRVALATVFAADSGVLLMDEPFGALDFVTRATLQRVLLDLWRMTGATIVFVTHDIEEALVLGDRILVVSDGRMLDDIACDLPRPRGEDERTSRRAVEISKLIIGHLGLAEETKA